MKLSLNTSFKKNNSLCITPKQLRENYLFGVSLTDRDGNKLKDSVIETYILQAQEDLEKDLSIKLLRQSIVERKSFFRDDWINWGHIKTTWPIVCPMTIKGFYADKKIVDYPNEWLSVNRISEDVFGRTLYIVPMIGISYSSLVYSQFSSHYVSFWGNLRTNMMPNYWEIEYVTGFDRKRIPNDLVSCLGKIICLKLLPVLSDSSYKIPGAGSTSLSLDGLSQSISNFGNGQSGVYGARVKQYSEELKSDLPKLRDYYKGIVFDVC